MYVQIAFNWATLERSISFRGENRSPGRVRLEVSQSASATREPEEHPVRVKRHKIQTVARVRRRPSQKDRTYQQFTTERPAFASDDLLQEPTESQSTVRATPLVQERGFLTNLLVSMAPFCSRSLILAYVLQFMGAVKFELKLDRSKL